jgi:nitrite reductase/ring-hydroxylating ferredoxin subunit
VDVTTLTSIELCSVDDVPAGQIRQFAVDGLDGAVAVANVEGEYFAFEDCCTHGAASLAEEGELSGHIVECGWHGGRFNIRTGEATASPCTINLQTYELDVRDGRIHLRLQV